LCGFCLGFCVFGLGVVLFSLGWGGVLLGCLLGGDEETKKKRMASSSRSGKKKEGAEMEAWGGRTKCSCQGRIRMSSHDGRGQKRHGESVCI